MLTSRASKVARQLFLFLHIECNVTFVPLCIRKSKWSTWHEDLWHSSRTSLAVLRSIVRKEIYYSLVFEPSYSTPSDVNQLSHIFLIIEPTRCTNSQNFILEWKYTCFRQFLCPWSGVFHCTHSDGICHTGLLTACEQEQMLLLASCHGWDGTKLHLNRDTGRQHCRCIVPKAVYKSKSAPEDGRICRPKYVGQN